MDFQLDEIDCSSYILDKCVMSGFPDSAFKRTPTSLDGGFEWIEMFAGTNGADFA